MSSNYSIAPFLPVFDIQMPLSTIYDKWRHKVVVAIWIWIRSRHRTDTETHENQKPIRSHFQFNFPFLAARWWMVDCRIQIGWNETCCVIRSQTPYCKPKHVIIAKISQSTPVSVMVDSPLSVRTLLIFLFVCCMFLHCSGIV